MRKLIDKDTLVAEIKRLIAFYSKEIEDNKEDSWAMDIAKRDILQEILSFLNTLEVKDSYEQCVQYDSIKAGIQAHAETYSFNIESLLFNQLTKKQQALWKKEIEQACISGGEIGVELAKDIRYKENVEMKKVDLEKEIKEVQHKYKTIEEYEGYPCTMYANNIEWIAKHFFELGLNAQCKISYVPNIDDSLEELGVDPTSKEAKIFKESYYIALEKLKAQKGD